MNGVITEKYLWRDAITILAVYDGNDNLISRFNYADGRLPISMTYGGTTYYLLYDQVGSLRAVVNTTGNIVKQIDYDSFGNIISDSNPSFTVPFGFAGGLHDRDTGLVKFGARDYDPALGRWTAKDPIDFYGGINLFNYISSDPVNWIDPWGLLVVGVYDQKTGVLILQDLDTKEIVSGQFFSGDTTSDPIPNGSYDILIQEGRSDFYRLEPVDSLYGDDIDQRTGRSLLRLHKP